MEREWWLRLSNARNLSPLQCTRLLNHFATPRAVCEASSAELQALAVKAEVIAELHNPDRSALDNQYRWLEQPQHFMLTLAEPGYPALLKTIACPPPVLFLRGNPSVLLKPQLALVGSRNPSPGGLKAATELAMALTVAGLTITSGLAVGIDGACHRAALAAGGSTIAVLGSGLSCIYPRQHRRLADEIAERGVLVSEFPPPTQPLPAHFPRRNRIISGLCCGVCVVEAAERSGSLITARLAVEQGREVFAVPGSIYNPKACGCHLLIQSGAKLIMTPADIVIELQQGISQWYIIPSEAQSLESEKGRITLLDSDCRQLLECVGFEATTVDELVQRSGRTVAQVTELLVTLELNSLIRATVGGYYRV